MARLGIAVITYRRREQLEQVVRKLAQHTRAPHELVIADDGSDDGTVEWCEARGLRVVTGERRGVAYNKNRGLFALASLGCDPILLLEDDAYPDVDGWEEDWVEATRRWHHVAYLHPCIEQWTLSGGGTPAEPFLNTKPSAVLLSISAETLARVGYFDPRFLGWGYEHGDWTSRITRAGYGYMSTLLSNGVEAQALFYLRGGVVANDGHSWRDDEEGRRNRALEIEIKREPPFRRPWGEDGERSVFLAEQLAVGLDGARLANAVDAEYERCHGLNTEWTETILVKQALKFDVGSAHWREETLDWPSEVGDFFLLGDIEVQADGPVEDLVVQAVFGDGADSLFWMRLVPQTPRLGRASFKLPRELAGETGGNQRDGLARPWSAVRTLTLRARLRSKGSMNDAAAAKVRLSDLRLLVLSDEANHVSRW